MRPGLRAALLGGIKRRISILNNVASDLTNYQVKILLPWKAGMRPDFGDIRFADGGANVPYWIESYTASTSAVVWVKLASLLASATKIITLSYGNHAASAANGATVFDFFDDFLGTAPSGTAGWNGAVVANPVLSTAGSTWESLITGDPSVVFDGTTYHMFYCGFDGTNNRVGYASSPDGKVWTKYGSNPVLDVGSSGAYDDLYAGKCSAVLRSGTWYLFYAAKKNSNGQGTICLATASSPTGPWTKHANNPLLVPAVGGYENNYLDCPCVIYDTDVSLWKMWYSTGFGLAVTGEPYSWSYATASAPQGPWTKYGGNPIALPAGDATRFGTALGGMNVTKIGGTYYNYYNAFNNTSHSGMGFNTSPDGVTWTVSASDLILDIAGGGWQSTQVYRPCFLLVNGVKKVWWNAKGTTEQIGYMEGLVLDSTKWTQAGSSVTPFYTLANGYAELTETQGGSGDCFVIKTASYVPGNNVIVETRERADAYTDASFAQVQHIIFADATPFPSSASNNQFMFTDRATSSLRHQSRSGGSWGGEDVLTGSLLPTLATWYRVKAVKKSTGIDWFLTDDSGGAVASLVGNTDAPVNFSYPLAFGVRGGKASFDWVRARQYAATEPTVTVN